MLEQRRDGKGAGEKTDESEESTKKRKADRSHIEAFLERPISKDVANEYDRKLLR